MNMPDNAENITQIWLQLSAAENKASGLEGHLGSLSKPTKMKDLPSAEHQPNLIRKCNKDVKTAAKTSP